LIEDLSAYSDNTKTPEEIFDETVQPTLWSFKHSEEEAPHAYAFGFPCGENICLVPLSAEAVDEQRILLWAAPHCENESDAKRIFFLVNELLDSLVGGSA
jgi:hypothetical protein